MRVSVITPIGPGHEKFAKYAEQSVREAWDYSKGAFTCLEFLPIEDFDGKLGRGAARNIGIKAADGEWMFFLDADDIMAKNAFEIHAGTIESAPELAAVYGTLWIFNGWSEEDGPKELVEKSSPFSIDPDQSLSWEDFARCVPQNTLHMGMFVRGDAARQARFLTYAASGEDFEFHMTICSRHQWHKVASPLVHIRNGGSSVGPKRATTDWSHDCRLVLEYWARRGRVPMTQKERCKPWYWRDHSGVVTRGKP